MCPPHRKQVKHYHEPGDLHELTFSTYRRQPLLTNHVWQSWLSQHIEEASRSQQCRLIAFVFMPEHLHLLILPEQPDPKTISRFLAAVKRPVSVKVKEALHSSGSPLLEKLTIQERPGKTVFRFWQEGAGYDRNLNREQTVMSAIDYIHENPVRRGLVVRASDWKWSSARWYETEGSVVDADLPELQHLPAEYFVRDSQNQIRSDE
ncbi:MAG: transposase [Planctomycetaceae bacterium]|nr:transposase [Planctomycetaceae bacterium]